MAKIKVWAKVGISFSVSIDKIPQDGTITPEQMDEIAREIESMIFGIGKLPHIDPSGESYIPANSISYTGPEGDMMLSNEESDLMI